MSATMTKERFFNNIDSRIESAKRIIKGSLKNIETDPFSGILMWSESILYWEQEISMLSKIRLIVAEEGDILGYLKDLQYTALHRCEATSSSQMKNISNANKRKAIASILGVIEEWSGLMVNQKEKRVK